MKQAVFIILSCMLVLSCNNESKKLSKAHETSVTLGKIVYNDFCIQCHMENGEGVEKVFPPLADSDYLKNNLTKSILGIKYGMEDEITVNGIKYNGVMTSMGLTDEEIANVINYITNSWGNKNYKMITTEEVSKIQLKK